jgi:hypothetical protein
MNAMTLSICVDDYPHTKALHRGETASDALNLAMQVVKPISKARFGAAAVGGGGTLSGNRNVLPRGQGHQ